MSNRFRPWLWSKPWDDVAALVIGLAISAAIIVSVGIWTHWQ